jgi:hypothetical protein
MDISVSHLNNRLALQLPQALPLGLVFVLGRVQNLSHAAAEVEDEPAGITFDLKEKGHTIRCRLSPRAATEVTLTEGVLIRAGGHLSFDPLQADYFLLARDVEIVEEKPETAVTEPQSRLEKTGLGKVLTDVKKRSTAVKQTPPDMPAWVQRLAPPDLASESDIEETTTTTVPSTGSVQAVSSPADLSSIDQKLVDFVDKALESEEEVELTPELLDQLMPTAPVGAKEQLPAATEQPALSKRPAGRPASPKKQPMDWLTAVLLLTLVMVLIVMAAILLLLWLR